MKSMKKSPKQNWESNIRRTPIILGLSAALCMPSAFSYANASDPVAGELVQSVQQGRTVTGKIIDDTGEPLIGVSVLVKGTTGVRLPTLTVIILWKFLQVSIFSSYLI